MINETPRVRFAPSPTGYLHVGGLRTALYNYLFAKKNNGKFILRIEDTDRNRYVEGAVENLIEAIKWSGLDYDEGPDKGGEFGPYMQSQRLDIYKKYADELVSQGKAYHCFCTPERLEDLRKEQQALKLPQAKYDKKCLSLNKEEVETRIKNGESYVIRMNVEPGPKVSFNDIVREFVQFDRDTIDDQVLIKADGYPTYHMANVVDDHLMKITHVIRGEEWLSSTPKHVLLYEYFGWETPVFCHLPLLLNPDKSKLSKRQGDVAVEDYRDKGYFKEALINFVALLGWNAGDQKEFYFIDELIENFSLERVHKAGAVFDIDKLNWLNFEHMKIRPNEQILPFLRAEINKSEYASNNLSDEFLLAVISAMKERVNVVKEYITNCRYLYEPPVEFDEKTFQKRWKEDSGEILNKLVSRMADETPASKEDFDSLLHLFASELGINMSQLIHPVRLAVSGTGAGPGLFDMLSILGKNEIISRINNALQILNKK